MKKYLEKFKKIINTKIKKKSKNRLFINQIEKRIRNKNNFFSKRKNLNINLSFLKLNNFFKKNYIPYLFISTIVIISILIFILLWPIFRVKYIDILKKDNVTNMDIAYKAMEYYRWKKIFDINEKEIFDRIKSYQENIKSLELSLDLPNKIKIDISSYKEIYSININWKSYFLLENWVIIPANNNKEVPFLDVKKEFDKNQFLDYKKVFNTNYTDAIKYIEESLKENILWIEIKELIYYEVERELHIIANNDIRLIFWIDSKESYQEQIKNLSVFNKEYENLIESELYYIDLRIINKIFTCDKSIWKNCSKNLKSVYSS